MDHKIFYDELRASKLFNGVITKEQFLGLQAKIKAWEDILPSADLRFIAYSLATAYHETAHVMQPIEEIGKGRGKSYGFKVGPYNKSYYGRGDVQLTWIANYKKAEKELRKRKLLRDDESLVKTPSLALRPDLSAAIMILGMIEGWFTGRKLSDYFKGNRSDWIDARRIINGTDKAALIASYAMTFLHALESAKEHKLAA